MLLDNDQQIVDNAEKEVIKNFLRCSHNNLLEYLRQQLGQTEMYNITK